MCVFDWQSCENGFGNRAGCAYWINTKYPWETRKGVRLFTFGCLLCCANPLFRWKSTRLRHCARQNWHRARACRHLNTTPKWLRVQDCCIMNETRSAEQWAELIQCTVYSMRMLTQSCCRWLGSSQFEFWILSSDPKFQSVFVPQVLVYIHEIGGQSVSTPYVWCCCHIYSHHRLNITRKLTVNGTYWFTVHKLKKGCPIVQEAHFSLAQLNMAKKRHLGMSLSREQQQTQQSANLRQSLVTEMTSDVPVGSVFLWRLLHNRLPMAVHD
jgi:hypothetical protein